MEQLFAFLDKVSQPLTVIGILVLILYKKEQKAASRELRVRDENGDNPIGNRIKEVNATIASGNTALLASQVQTRKALRRRFRVEAACREKHQEREEKQWDETLKEIRRIYGAGGSDT